MIYFINITLPKQKRKFIFDYRLFMQLDEEVAIKFKCHCRKFSQEPVHMFRMKVILVAHSFRVSGQAVRKETFYEYIDLLHCDQ